MKDDLKIVLDPNDEYVYTNEQNGGPACPFCGTIHTWDELENSLYPEEDEEIEVTCHNEECEKEFVFTASKSWSWRGYKPSPKEEREAV